MLSSQGRLRLRLRVRLLFPLPNLSLEPFVQHTNQVIQPLDAEIRMLMTCKMSIHLVYQQNRGGPGPKACRHIVKRIANHDQAFTPIWQGPLRRDVQDTSRVRLRRAKLARYDRGEDLAVQES